MAKFLINGVEIIFEDTDENINLLRTDDDFTRNYIEAALANGSLKEFGSDVSQLHVERVSDSSDAALKWTHNLTKLLLNKRLENESSFNRPTCKKKKLWNDIAHEISKATTVSISGEACDIKYRNLLATYRANKKKQTKTGEGSINWEYFSIMDEVLGHKASSSPQTELLGGSMMKDDTDTSSLASTSSASSSTSSASTSSSSASTSTSSASTSSSSASTSTSSASASTSTSSASSGSTRKRKMTVSDYLHKKLQLHEEREKRKEEMQREKLRLKEREIDAILELARAISGRKQ
ncbi:hypothetical protein ANN_14866 [Periplaneta americana]|uniref:Myb/SANT-like DNA-binding domain-containing protein n=1 Tax=Periplaneta americana TaxID=6978 RepID=A0ABQ8SXG3_PERAM|nr:hypothetical protein ANN_14866 [Periplaneta americana]